MQNSGSQLLGKKRNQIHVIKLYKQISKILASLFSVTAHGYKEHLGDKQRKGRFSGHNDSVCLEECESEFQVFSEF